MRVSSTASLLLKHPHASSVLYVVAGIGPKARAAPCAPAQAGQDRQPPALPAAPIAQSPQIALPAELARPGHREWRVWPIRSCPRTRAGSPTHPPALRRSPGRGCLPRRRQAYERRARAGERSHTAMSTADSRRVKRTWIMARSVSCDQRSGAVVSPVACSAFVTSSEVISSASSTRQSSCHRCRVCQANTRPNRAALGTAASASSATGTSTTRTIPPHCKVYVRPSCPRRPSERRVVV